MKKNNKQGMSVGVISLITIFVVFLLVSLAVLSLTTASANTRTAKKSMIAQTEYYTADEEAQVLISQIHEMIKTAKANQETFTQLNESIVYEDQSQMITFQTKINETSAIRTRLQFKADSSYDVLEWKTVNTGEWKTKDTINNLWKGN